MSTLLSPRNRRGSPPTVRRRPRHVRPRGDDLLRRPWSRTPRSRPYDRSADAKGAATRIALWNRAGNSASTAWPRGAPAWSIPWRTSSAGRSITSNRPCAHRRRAALAIRFDDIPADVVALAKTHFLDQLGVGLAAAALPRNRPLAALAAAFGTGGNSTALGFAAPVTAAAAALRNGALMHSLEYDGTHTASITHAGSVVAPVALAVCEETGASGAGFCALLSSAGKCSCAWVLPRRAPSLSVGSSSPRWADPLPVRSRRAFCWGSRSSR